jgi:hypothetical protein
MMIHEAPMVAAQKRQAMTPSLRAVSAMTTLGGPSGGGGGAAALDGSSGKRRRALSF